MKAETKKEVLFVGVGRQVGDYGRLKLMMHRDQVAKLVQYLEQDGGDFVFLLVDKSKKEGAKWTHYVAIDTWKPEKKVVREDASSDGFVDDGF